MEDKAKKTVKKNPIRRILRIILNILYYGVLIVVAVCLGSILINKIQNPDSPPTIFKYQLYIDATNSMVPDLHANDLIIVEKNIDEEINVGDIVTYREGNSTVTHRVMEIVEENGEMKYRTKGDHNNAADDRLIERGEIEGKYLSKVPFLGFFIADKVSLILLALILLIVIFFPYHLFKKDND